jgi:hypothetical protein
MQNSYCWWLIRYKYRQDIFRAILSAVLSFIESQPGSQFGMPAWPLKFKARLRSTFGGRRSLDSLPSEGGESRPASQFGRPA